MAATAAPATAAPAAAKDTASDTLIAKDRSGDVVSGGHLVARALRGEGVDTVFTLCGGHIIDIYDGCIDEGIRIVDVRHEQVAAHAADGYARQTGRLGCVVTTAGPGFTNAMTGIATAFRSESPVLHIGGQGALSQHKMGSLQDLPHVDIAAPITKFSASVPSTERIADMVSMAARECFAGAPGAELSRDPARRAGPRGDGGRRGHPRAGALPGVAEVDRRPGGHRAPRRPPRQERAARDPARDAGLDLARARGGPSPRPRSSTSPPTSTGRGGASSRPAIRTTSTARAAMRSRRRTSSSSSAPPSTSGWATASGSGATRRWCRSTSTTAPSARTAT